MSASGWCTPNAKPTSTKQLISQMLERVVHKNDCTVLRGFFVMRCAALEKLWMVRSTDSSMAGFLNFARILSASFTKGRSTFSTSWGFRPPTAMTNTRPPHERHGHQPERQPARLQSHREGEHAEGGEHDDDEAGIDGQLHEQRRRGALARRMPLRVAVALTSDVPARFIEGATVFMKKVPNTSESPVR